MQVTEERVYLVPAPKELQFHGAFIPSANSILLLVRQSTVIRQASTKKLKHISSLPQAKYQSFVNAARLELIFRSPKCPDCKGSGSYNSPSGPRLCNRCNGSGMRIE